MTCIGRDAAGRAVWRDKVIADMQTVTVRDESGGVLLSADLPASKSDEQVLSALADYSPPEKTPSERRAARYKVEADPLLLASVGYQLEYEAAPTPALLDKLTTAKADYLAAKARIRQEIQ